MAVATVPTISQSQATVEHCRRKGTPIMTAIQPRRAADRSPVADPIAGRGRRGRGIRHSGRRDPAGLRPAVRLHQGPARAGPARAGRRTCGRGLRPGDRPGRRLHGHLRARAPPTWSPRSSDAFLDSVPMVAITGQVAVRRDRHRRLPGGRHLRDHAADHQAQLPGAARRPDPADHRRGVPPGHHRTSRPGAGGHPEGRAAGRDLVQLAADAGPARLPAGAQAARQADSGGGQADRRRRSDRCSTSAAGCSRRMPPASCGSWPS